MRSLRPEEPSSACMKPVVQEEGTGCGIASVATLAGVSYRQARRAAGRLGISAEDPRLWSETGHVRRLLKQYGLRAAAKETPFLSWETLPDLALLAVKWHRAGGRAFWHWVVFRRGPQGPVVLDPKLTLRTHVRTDFGRMKPKWFIAVMAPTRQRTGRTSVPIAPPADRSRLTFSTSR